MKKVDWLAHNVMYVSKLNNFDFCPYATYLDSYVKDSKLPMTGFMARNVRFKEAAKRLIPDPNGHYGPALLRLENLMPEELQEHLKFRSPDSFARRMITKYWLEDVINGRQKVHDRTVVWTKEGLSKVATGQFYNKCRLYYLEHLLAHGMPIPAFIEKEYSFKFRGKKFIMRFNEVRKGKELGVFMTAAPKVPVATDWQITLQILAYCRMAAELNGQYRFVLGIDPDFTDECREKIIHPGVKFVYHHAARKKEKTNGKERKWDEHHDYETHREPADLEQMLDALEDIKARAIKAKRTRKYQPNHRNCKICRFNVKTITNKPVCEARDKSKPIAEPLTPEIVLNEEEMLEEVKKEWFE